MNSKSKIPLPVCKAFLVCRQIIDDARTKEPILVGLPKELTAAHYPAARQLWFFARWVSTHGDYRVEVQLQNMAGDVVWRDGPPEEWSMPSPVSSYDLRLELTPVFPDPGKYDIVLLANGEEVARQAFEARLAAEPAQRR